MNYIDGYVAAVPNENKDKYIEHSKLAAAAFKDHGAIKIVETWGDDVPEGEVTSFHKAVDRKENETIVFSWVLWPSKEARNKGMEAAMKDPRFHPDNNPMPFDGKRLIYGGFQMIVDE